MSAGILEGIGVPAFQDRIGFGGKLGHAASLAGWDKIRNTRAIVGGTASARCTNSVSSTSKAFSSRKKSTMRCAARGLAGQIEGIGHEFAVGVHRTSRWRGRPFRQRYAKPAMFIRREVKGALPRGLACRLDRPDHVCDVARRRRLAPAFLDRPSEVAFEAGEEYVVLDDQHPSQMEIAVQARIESLLLRAASGVQALMQVVLLRQEVVRSSRGRLRRMNAALPSGIWKTRQRSGRSAWSAGDVRRLDRLRRKIGYSACAGKSQMQFGRATADLRQVTHIGALLFAFRLRPPPTQAGAASRSRRSR